LKHFGNVLIFNACYNFADFGQDKTIQKGQKRKSTDSSASPKTLKNQKKGNFRDYNMHFNITVTMYCLHVRGFINVFSKRILTGLHRLANLFLKFHRDGQTTCSRQAKLSSQPIDSFNAHMWYMMYCILNN